MKAKDYNSYQGTAIAVAKTDLRGVVRLLRCDNGMPYVVHQHVHLTSEGGEGTCGHYYDDIKEAWEDFEDQVGEENATFYNLDDPRVEAIVKA